MAWDGALDPVSDVTWEIPRDHGMRVPVRVYGSKSIVTTMRRDKTLEQATNVAKLPGIISRSFVMPDGHQGYGFPIGGVAAFSLEDGVVSPGGVGYDINCGVRLLTTPFTGEEIRPGLKELLPTLFRNIPSGVGSKGRLRVGGRHLEEVMVQGARWAVDNGYGTTADLEHMEESGCIAGADPSRIDVRARKRGVPQLGTLGAGNHFLEVQEVAEVYDEHAAKAFGVEEGQAMVMLHCGSRGFGHQVCSDYVKIMLATSRTYGISLPDKELACAPLGSREADNYLAAMFCAVNYAFCNRQVITHWVRESFKQVFGGDPDMRLVYDVCHNIAKLEEHEVDGKRSTVCVHRKGATRAFGPGRSEVPADYRDVGQPVIIPGDMGTESYLLAGTENAMKECFGSTCHGAGRVMSRHQAVREFGGNTLKQELSDKGIAVMATNPRIIAEEAPGAYKDVSAVVDSVQAAGLARKVARMVPLAVAKG